MGGSLSAFVGRHTQKHVLAVLWHPQGGFTLSKTDRLNYSSGHVVMVGALLLPLTTLNLDRARRLTAC